MRNEHNPIARLIGQIQQKWNDEIAAHPERQLARWIIKDEQARLFQGFLKLESTSSGKIPDMVLVLLSPFESKEFHSNEIVKHWLEMAAKDKEVLEQFSEKYPEFEWKQQEFEQRANNEVEDQTALLLDMMSALQLGLDKEKRSLTLALYPYTVSSPTDYATWLDGLMARGLPENSKLMIFDYEGERYFDRLMKRYQEESHSMSIPLDIDGAISKLMSQGDPNDPEVIFRKCMIKMGKATESKELSKLHHWGQKAIEAAQKSGSRSFFASAHLVYAGMLFSFKEFEEIDDLLAKALNIAKKGINAGDKVCQNLLIQILGFMGSSLQSQKKREAAMELFLRQAETALEHGYPPQPLMSYWMAYSVIRKRDREQYEALVEKAYRYGIAQEKELLKASCMPFVAGDYRNLLEKQNLQEEIAELDSFMTELEGENWHEELEERQKEMNKKRFSLKNMF